MQSYPQTIINSIHEPNKVVIDPIDAGQWVVLIRLIAQDRQVGAQLDADACEALGR